MASVGYYDLTEYDPAVRMMEHVLKMCDEKGADLDIRQGIELAVKLSKERLNYCVKVTTEASPSLNTLFRETMTYPFAKAFDEGITQWNLKPHMVSGSLEGKFLQSIVMMNKSKSVLEIGTFTGYAALACAEVLPADGKVVTCEFDPFLKDVARSFFKNSPHGKKIDIRVGRASDTLDDLGKQNRQFDVIFVDANKDGYMDYYKAIMSKGLLSTQGVIVFDNCLHFGIPYGLTEYSMMAKISETLPDQEKRQGKEIKAFNEFMKTQHDTFRVLLPLRDGVLLVQRKPVDG